MEAVSCEEACDAGADATQERPRRSSVERSRSRSSRRRHQSAPAPPPGLLARPSVAHPRARQEAGWHALEEFDVEAVSCEEACDAGADATQERPRRSDAGPAKAQPRGSSRGPAQRAQTTRCKRGCGRPSAEGYDTCCRTCIQTDGQQHGPQCERRWEELAREAKTITHQERITQGWICENCDFSNFLERPTCRECETARPAITRSPEHLPGSRVDVLDAADAYPGWERDLRSQHSVISKPISHSKKNKQSFQCELCDVWLPSWSQVQGHCRGAQHKKKKAALGTKCVPASSVDSSL